MINLSPRGLSRSTALITAVITTVIAIIAHYFIAEKSLVVYFLIVGLTTLSISYIAYLGSLERYITAKIRIIYKTIHTLKTSKSKQQKINLKKNIIEEVNQEVIEWAKSKKKEIEQLKKSADYRREFLANVSHELKTPIFNIEGYIHTLVDGGLEDSSINRDYLKKAAKNLDRLTAIIEDLEIISQLESGHLSITPETFDIVELTREVFEELEIPAKNNQIELRFKNPNNKHIKVNADPERIRQVMVNLISNSIKYGKTGGRTRVDFFDMEENVLIEISDNGIGIDEKHLPRLFERFYRVDKSRSRERGGTGLGLSIVKHIIEAHHQTISVRSTQHVGTTFGFTLLKV